MAERKEQRYRTLVIRGRVPEHEAAQRAQFRDQVRRSDDVAKAQPRSQRLRHRADIDDTPGAIQALQRLLRRFVEDLAVVAVLDDDLIGTIVGQ